MDSPRAMRASNSATLPGSSVLFAAGEVEGGGLIVIVLYRLRLPKGGAWDRAKPARRPYASASVTLYENHDPTDRSGAGQRRSSRRRREWRRHGALLTPQG